MESGHEAHPDTRQAPSCCKGRPCSHSRDNIQQPPACILACSIDGAHACRLRVVGGVPELNLGSICGLRSLFPGLRGPDVQTEFWLDVSASIVWYGDRRAVLSSEEFILLAMAASNEGRYVESAEVARTVWGESKSRRARVLVRRTVDGLRRKLEAAGLPCWILENTERSSIKVSKSAERTTGSSRLKY